MNLMGFMSTLGAWSKDVFTGEWEWVTQLFDVLYPLLYTIMALTAAAGMVYAVYLGINLAKAEDQSKRDEAKKRLITTVIAVAVVIVLVLFFNELLPAILANFVNKDNFELVEGQGFIHI